MRKPTRRQVLKAAVGAITTAAAANARPAAADLALNAVPDMVARRKTHDSIYKQRAILDYQENMRPFGGQLSNPIDQLLVERPRPVPWQFDVLVIGSGYGAAITAARLAQRMRPGGRLGILERGKEWIPGTFGDTLKEVTDSSRLNLFGNNKRGINNPIGLFNVLQYEEMAVLSGSGLGGSSLINANVAIRPDREVFEQPVWPALLRNREWLDPFYDLAALELGVQREPIDWTTKMSAQRRAVEQLADCGAHVEAAAITVTRGNPNDCLPIINRHGIRQRACIDCGDCLTGCNVGAKNTLMMNYLPLARRFGAEMYTQTEVIRIEKLDGYYRVHFKFHCGTPETGFQTIFGTTTARILAIGAGSVGTTEILLRSRECGLVLSHRIGCSWTGNGDALGFILKGDCPTHIAGFGAYEPDGRRVGPTIQTNVFYPHRTDLRQRILIQEGAAARAYANALGALMQDFDLDRTLVLLGMGHDGAAGKVSLAEDGDAIIQWPGLLESEYRAMIRNEFQQLARAHNGNYKFLRAFGDRMISVHPLGGCAMADDPRYGVVNHKGQVFDTSPHAMHHYANHSIASAVAPNTGSDAWPVHFGLYVVDGAAVPTSIACNPLLTISALAERSAQLIIQEPAYRDLFAV